MSSLVTSQRHCSLSSHISVYVSIPDQISAGVGKGVKNDQTILTMKIFLAVTPLDLQNQTSSNTQ